MTIQQPSHDHTSSRRSAATPLRFTAALLLGVLAAVLVSCGSSGAGLIPAGNAGPLQADFEAIARSAEGGNGSCSATEAAVAKTEADFNSLPASVNGGLRTRLREGITHLRSRALTLCAQPLAQPTVASQTTKTNQSAPSTTPTTTTPATTPTNTQTTTTNTPPPAAQGPGGGTKAPDGEPSQGGGTEPPASGGAGAGGQEGGK